MRKSIGFLLIAALGGCDSDVVDPKIEMIEVRVGGEMVSAVDPSAVSDTTIEDDVPLDATLVLLFNEPVTLTSAREHMELKDTEGMNYDINVTQRLDEISVAPASGAFVPATTLVLDIARGIEDTSGRDTDRNLSVNFFTAAM